MSAPTPDGRSLSSCPTDDSSPSSRWNRPRTMTSPTPCWNLMTLFARWWRSRLPARASRSLQPATVKITSRQIEEWMAEYRAAAADFTSTGTRCARSVRRLDGVRQHFGGGQVVLFSLALAGRVPQPPQWRRRRRRGHHAASETVIEDLKQFIQDRVGVDVLSLRVQQRQHDAEQIGVAFQAVFFETREAEVLRNGITQAVESLAEPLSRRFSCGHVPSL